MRTKRINELTNTQIKKLIEKYSPDGRVRYVLTKRYLEFFLFETISCLLSEETGKPFRLTRPYVIDVCKRFENYVEKEHDNYAQIDKGV